MKLESLASLKCNLVALNRLVLMNLTGGSFWSHLGGGGGGGGGGTKDQLMISAKYVNELWMILYFQCLGLGAVQGVVTSVFIL